MVNSLFRRNIPGILAVISLVFSAVYFPAYATASGTGDSTGKSSAASKTVTQTTQSQVTQNTATQAALGKLLISFVDPVTNYISGSEAQVLRYSDTYYGLEIALEGGVTCKQIWDINAREALNNAVSRFAIDENGETFRNADARSFTAYATTEGMIEWTYKVTGNTYSASPLIDMGYLVTERKAFFLITQRDAEFTDASGGNTRSDRFSFGIDMNQARQLIGLFNGKFYEKPLLAFIGDGVTLGLDNHSISPESLVPGILQSMLKINILNIGEEWLTTGMADQDYLETLQIYDPDVFIINLGLMDFFDKKTPQETGRNLQNIINLFKKTGRKIYLARFYDNWILKNSMTY